MTRWEPDARGRLMEAAMSLFVEHGYDRTTVADIAARAGLTERTFFRHFTDKREVLFSGSEQLERFLVDAVAAAPAGASAMEAVGEALTKVAAGLEALRTFDQVEARHALVLAHEELRERELIKLAKLGVRLAEALRLRGVGEPTASLAAEAGLGVFKVAFERWAGGVRPRSFPAHVAQSLEVLRGLTVKSVPPPPRPAQPLRKSTPKRPTKPASAARKTGVE